MFDYGIYRSFCQSGLTGEKVSLVVENSLADQITDIKSNISSGIWAADSKNGEDELNYQWNMWIIKENNG